MAAIEPSVGRWRHIHSHSRGATRTGLVGVKLCRLPVVGPGQTTPDTVGCAHEPTILIALGVGENACLDLEPRIAHPALGQKPRAATHRLAVERDRRDSGGHIRPRVLRFTARRGYGQGD